MFEINENNVGRFNLISSLVLLLAFALSIIYFSVLTELDSYERLKSDLEKKFIDRKKSEFKTKVLNIERLIYLNIEELESKDEKKERIIKLLEELNRDKIRDYFFVFELIKSKDGEYLEKIVVHPTVKKGKILDKDRVDIDGKKFVREFQKRLLENNSTFLDYSYLHPKTKEEERKISFMVLNRELNWIIGSGFFIDDIVSELDRIEKNLKSEVNDEIEESIIITLIFLVIFIFSAVVVNRYYSRVIKNFRIRVEEKERELLDSEFYLKQYSSIIERHSLVTKSNLDGVITYVSEDFCKTTGYSKEEFIGKNHDILEHPNEDSRVYEDAKDDMKNKNFCHALFKNITKDGKTIYLDTNILPIYDKEHRLMEYISLSFDITKEVLLQEKLQFKNQELTKSRDSLRLAQEIAHIGSWELDLTTNTLVWSDEVYRIFGKDSSKFQLTYEYFLERIHPDDRELVNRAYVDSLEKRCEYSVEHRVISDDGKVIYVEENAIHRFDKSGKVIKSIGTIHDITAKKIDEEKLKEKDLMLLQQSKMATMGEMIGNIAHQWRQPLSTISTLSTGTKLQKEMGILSDEQLVESMDNINNSVQYLSKTIDDFRNFFKPQKSKGTFSISDTFDKTFELIKAQFNSRDIEIIRNIDDIEFYGLENELLQVLINILNNARDELIKKEYRRLIFIDSYKEDDFIIIKIKDNAGGIPQEIIDKVFQPYFSTKEDEGTGIGLYMSEEIITKHMKGKISVENISYDYEGESYMGASFKITLSGKD